MARNPVYSDIGEYKKLRCYGQDAGPFYIKHDTFISKGREENFKILKKVTLNQKKENEIKIELKQPVEKEVETRNTTDVETREMNPEEQTKELSSDEETRENGEILAGGGLMTSKTIQARNKALSRRNTHKKIRRPDQSQIKKIATEEQTKEISPNEETRQITPHEETREMTPEEETKEMSLDEGTRENEDILAGGGLMTSKTIKARNKALARRNTHKKIMKPDQSQIKKIATEEETKEISPDEETRQITPHEETREMTPEDETKEMSLDEGTRENGDILAGGGLMTSKTIKARNKSLARRNTHIKIRRSDQSQIKEIATEKETKEISPDEETRQITPHEVTREMTPEGETKEMSPHKETRENGDILADRALMTSKTIQARNKALARRNTYKQIRRPDQSQIKEVASDNGRMKNMFKVTESDKSKTSGEESSKPMSCSSNDKTKLVKQITWAETEGRKQINLESPAVKLPPKIKVGKLKTIDQLNIIVPEDKERFECVKRPGLCSECSVC